MCCYWWVVRVAIPRVRISTEKEELGYLYTLSLVMSLIHYQNVVYVV